MPSLRLLDLPQTHHIVGFSPKSIVDGRGSLAQTHTPPFPYPVASSVDSCLLHECFKLAVSDGGEDLFIHTNNSVI